MLLGAGTRLLADGPGNGNAALERTRVVESPAGVTHLGYRVVR